MEVWKDIPGYEGRYQVSNLGNVRRANGKLMRFDWGNKEHPRVYLYDGFGGRKRYLVYQLEMLAFVGPKPDGMIVRHLNDNPRDNRLCNLAYGTYGDNARDAVRNGRNKCSNKRKCPSGHSYDTYGRLDDYGHRHCIICDRAYAYHRLHPSEDIDALKDEYARKFEEEQNG